MGIWSTATLDVRVNHDDYQRACDQAIERDAVDESVTVEAEVDIDEVLEHATVEQLRDALGREEAPGYTIEQLEAIRDCFAALIAGDTNTAVAVLPRVFEHAPQLAAAEQGMQLYTHRRAA